LSTLSRRDVLGNLVVALAAPQLAGAGPLIADGGEATGRPLALSDFQPKSMLHVPQTAVARARFPVIDIHTHISWLAAHDHGVAVGEKMTFLAPPSELLPVMDRRNVRMMVDLTGGFGAGLAETIERYQRPHPDRFAIFTTPCWERIQESNYPQHEADQIMAAHRAGARGLKIEKILGLYLREQVGTGPLVKVDDRRFDPMWEACGAAGASRGHPCVGPRGILPTDQSF
jgi:hypothetical protein